MDWIPDENALSGTTHLTVADIAEYEMRHGIDPAAEVALLRDLGLSEAHCLVDFGAGAGSFALAAAAHAGEVVAVDPSPAMCDYVRRRLDDTGIANVSVVNAGFLTYEHEGPRPTFVFSRNALHHLSDFWKMHALVRIAALLVPGGCLRLRDVAYSFPPALAERYISAWIESAGEEGWSGADYAGHVRTEFSTYAWVLEAMLDHAGFDITDRHYSTSKTFAYYTCRRRN